ncbi:hypothetical protein B0H14DRAFT_2559469 [Mycena olivaceomarginata]|nr:hypothetical protein B0H14DRAFT_2559469 [Mycena olivaceomarginata]
MAAFAPANASCHCIPPDVIVETFGALLIGFLIQQFLLGVIITQACTYYSRFHRRDIKLYRHIIYRTSINHYGQRVSFDSLGWTIWAEPGVTAIGVLLAQFFFIDRCWNVIKRPWTILPLFGLLLLLPAGSGLAMSILSFKVKVWSEINKLPIPTSIWLGSMAATDTAIGVILCASFLRARAFCCHAPTRPPSAPQPAPLSILLSVYTIMVLFTLLQRDGLRKKFDEQAIYDISLLVFDPQYNNSLKPDDASVEVSESRTSNSPDPGFAALLRLRKPSGGT